MSTLQRIIEWFEVATERSKSPAAFFSDGYGSHGEEFMIDGIYDLKALAACLDSTEQLQRAHETKNQPTTEAEASANNKNRI